MFAKLRGFPIHFHFYLSARDVELLPYLYYQDICVTYIKSLKSHWYFKLIFPSDVYWF